MNPDLEPLYALIRKFEGFRSKPYLCPAGVWTIGYGTTKDITKNTPPITKEQAESLMKLDALQSYREALALSPNLQAHPLIACAIADFVYNLGSTRYARSTLRKKVALEDWQGACEQLQKWVWGGGQKLPGLVARRLAEVQMIQSAS